MDKELSLELINACLLMQQKDLACNEILFDLNTGLLLEQEQENQKTIGDSILQQLEDEKRFLEEQFKQKNNNKEIAEKNLKAAIKELSAKQEKYKNAEEEVQQVVKSCEAQKDYIHNVESDLTRIRTKIKQIENREIALKKLENEKRLLDEQFRQKNKNKEETEKNFNEASQKVTAKEQKYNTADSEWWQAVESYETTKNDLHDVESNLIKIRNKIKDTCSCTWWEWDDLIEKKEALKRDLKQKKEELNQRESDKNYKENIKTKAHAELQKQIELKNQAYVSKNQAYEDLRTFENNLERSKTYKELDLEKQNQNRKGSLVQKEEELKRNLDDGKSELNRRETDKNHKENIKTKAHAELQKQIELKNQAEELKNQAEEDLKTFDNHPIRIQALEPEENLAKQKFVDAHEILTKLRSQVDEIKKNIPEITIDMYSEEDYDATILNSPIKEQEPELSLD